MTKSDQTIFKISMALTSDELSKGSSPRRRHRSAPKLLDKPQLWLQVKEGMEEEEKERVEGNYLKSL